MPRAPHCHPILSPSRLHATLRNAWVVRARPAALAGLHAATLAVLCCCGDRMDPSRFANYATRLEMVGTLKSLNNSVGPVYIDPSDTVVMTVSDSDTLTSLVFVPPDRTRGYHDLLRVADGTRYGTVAELPGYVVLGASTDGSSPVRAVVLATDPSATGKTMAMLEIPGTAVTTTGAVLAADGIAAVQVQKPPGLALFDMRALPETPTLIGVTADERFGDVTGGKLFQRHDEIFGLAVAPNRIVPFAVATDLRVTVGEPVTLESASQPTTSFDRRLHGSVVLAPDEIAYVTDTGTSVFVIDLADPMQPRLLSAAHGLVRGQDMTLSPDGYLAIANGASGVALFDVSRPLSPTLLNICRIGTARYLAARWPYLYASGASGVVVLEAFAADAQ